MLSTMTQPQRGPASNAFNQAFLSGIEGTLELVLVRHGQQSIPSAPNARIGDSVDAPLSELGREQARLVGERFATESIDAVYSSGLSRAFDTGAAIGSHHGLEPVVVDNLREIGMFRDVPPDQTAAEALGVDYLAGVRERMARERSWDVFPLTESSAEFSKRVINAFEEIIARHEGEAARVVVACHGGVINAYTGYIIETSNDMFFRPAHASVHLVCAKGWFRALHSLNDTRHLETEKGSFVTY
ncbi:MAG: histidine phosphatase family protein [Dehalococcoidia bacterium]|nr:histidine phosphatase family protein [Dehalococcoidia bacterium]HCU99797.1 histidine phosphatase family protein [Dehalococcoidia bacterium]|tara:strand:- start:557 stop:1288 length:732 start_codon:yes stop_codon:yes gene_type:complete